MFGGGVLSCAPFFTMTLKLICGTSSCSSSTAVENVVGPVVECCLQVYTHTYMDSGYVPPSTHTHLQIAWPVL